MGGGRSGLFPGTSGADEVQSSLFEEKMKVRHRGPTFIVGEGVSGSGLGGSTAEVKLKLLTVDEVLKKCLLYRIGAWRESKLITWIQRTLADTKYSIAPNLRTVLKIGLVDLKSAKTSAGVFDSAIFMIALEQLEQALEKLQ